MEAGGIGKGVRQMKPRKVICPNCGKKLISNFSLVEIKAGGRKYYVCGYCGIQIRLAAKEVKQ